MLLVIDVGNTNIVIGAYEGVGAAAKLVGDWRIRTDRERTTDEHGMLIKDLLRHRELSLTDIDRVAISSVVPTMNDTLADLSIKYFHSEPFFVSAQTSLGIEIKYSPPSDVGADRICNAVGAYEKYGGPAIVIDFGTATTFDAVGPKGEYLGGAILPGVGISMDALFRNAARLYRVSFTAPPKAVGNNTAHSMQSGFVFGFAGQTDAMVAKMQQEMGETRVIATGGLAELIHAESKSIEVVDQLVTLDGLRILYERTQAATPAPGK